MPITRPAARWLLNGACHDGCSVGPTRLGKEAYALLHADIERGYADLSVAERSNERGTAVSHGAVNRHRKRHLLLAADGAERADYASLSQIEALELAIKRGQTNIDGWKFTPSEWMKAVELHIRLTQGNVYDAFLDAVASAGQEVADGGPEGGGAGPGDVGGAADAP